MKKLFNKKMNAPGMRSWYVTLGVFSVLFWNLYLYPNVDPFQLKLTGTHFYVILINYIFLFYFLLPLVWMTKAGKNLKIISTIFFVTVLVFWFFKGKEIYSNLKDSSEIETALNNIISYFKVYFLYIIIFLIPIFISIFINYKILITRFLNKIRFRLFLLFSTFLCVVASLINYAQFDLFLDKIFPSLFYISHYKVYELFLIHAAYLFFTTIVVLIWQYRMMLVAKRDSIQSELSALKAQINPHFLFNNLNTIYGMALEQDSRTPDLILRLSDFLRYVLYDTASDYIELSKEAQILETYISLQKERINPKITKVELLKEGDFGDVMIAPLLLLPLAENCFKYGKGRQNGKIIISLRFDGCQLFFETENVIARRDKPNGVKSSGLGIHNVVKRLNLIYPEKHSFSYNESEGVFKLKLEIKLT